MRHSWLGLALSACGATLLVGLLSGLPRARAVDLPLDDAWVYRDLVRLRAEGLIQSGSLLTLPVSRREAARMVREAGRVAGERADPHLDATLLALEEVFAREINAQESGTRPVYATPEYLRGSCLFREGPLALENAGGLRHQEEQNGYLQAAGSFALGPLSGRTEGELFGLEGGEDGPADFRGRLHEGYLALTLGKWQLNFGREELWWGPGRAGALLLSNNARALTTFRVTNDTPILLPGPLARLGPLHVTWFLTRLEEEIGRAHV
jgi:hypothetical protein